ncbi:hypothetical protein CBR_g321 [Chara braunii]|uniref:Uncharacterized protein n=1 Tax=Chara braunii TaxID=69332 RepID=A0A388JQD5_CHABU|nr:hypothetical protein CBR_g321 [Chara braunii]|eukprot:GBG59991.1 hypothetical protein CBR_g321 [Chara braunii]
MNRLLIPGQVTMPRMYTTRGVVVLQTEAELVPSNAGGTMGTMETEESVHKRDRGGDRGGEEERSHLRPSTDKDERGVHWARFRSKGRERQRDCDALCIGAAGHEAVAVKTEVGGITVRETVVLKSAAMETAAVETAAAETGAVETHTMETAAVETATVDTESVKIVGVEIAAVETAGVETAGVETATVENAVAKDEQAGEGQEHGWGEEDIG